MDQNIFLTLWLGLVMGWSVIKYFFLGFLLSITIIEKIFTLIWTISHWVNSSQKMAILGISVEWLSSRTVRLVKAHRTAVNKLTVSSFIVFLHRMNMREGMLSLKIKNKKILPLNPFHHYFSIKMWLIYVQKKEINFNNTSNIQKMCSLMLISASHVQTKYPLITFKISWFWTFIARLLMSKATWYWTS